MRKLLVPIDGSEGAARALQHALKLATESGPTELHLVVVHPEPAMYGEIQVYVSKQKMDELQTRHSEDILRPALETLGSAAVPHTGTIVTGEPAQSIVNKAEELGCDGIVMATRGMGAIGNLVLGSVATKVVHLSKLPVTLVK